MDRLRHAIIGCSAAGTKAAETLRRLRPDDEITVISDETSPLYSRCLLPHLLGGSRDEDGIRFRPEDFFSRWRLNRVLGASVTAVEPDRSRVIIQGNGILEYDRLLIATGSSSFIPPVPGLAGPRVLGLRTLDDARRIGALARASRRVVIVGAGFVGLEAAYALRRKGLEVTVAEKLPGILPQQMDHEAAGIIQKDIEDAGVRLVLGTGILEVREGGQSLHVILEDERALEADFVIVAAGTRPNVGFLEQSGIHVERGIPVDGQMSTNVQSVYAAGDVAVTVDAVTGSSGLTPIWPNAVVQGRVAGFNMAGRNRLYSSQIALQNAVEFQDVPAVSLGLSRPPKTEGYEVISMYSPARGIYRKMVLRGDIPVGMILVGDIRQSGVVASLIRRRRPLAKDLKEAFLRGNLHTGYLLSMSPRKDHPGQA